MTQNLRDILGTTVFDAKSKQALTSLLIDGVLFSLRDRVEYVGSSPCFRGQVGTLEKIKKRWLSKRSAGRAGFSGGGGHYTVTVYVLWDGGEHPQSCQPTEISLR